MSLDKLRSEGLIGENFISLENANHALELLLGSYATIALLANFVFNVFILLNLCLKVSVILFHVDFWFLIVNNLQSCLLVDTRISCEV